jgi:hypothetical protein
MIPRNIYKSIPTNILFMSEPNVCTFVGSRKIAMRKAWQKLRAIGLDKATNEDFRKAIREAWAETKKEIEKCK